MRVAVLLHVGLCACIVVTAAQDRGDRGPSGVVNGRTEASVNACTAMGVPFCSSCENPHMLCYDCLGGSVIYPDNRGCKDCDTADCWECKWNADGTTTFCVECYNGFTLNSQGSCDPCGASCRECVADDAGVQTCTECSDRAVLSNLDPANCISCGSNCLACSIAVDDTITCTSCAEGYYVNDFGRCESCQSNCLTCSKPDTQKLCSSCRGDFQLSEDNTKCLVCPAGCSACSGPAASGSRGACTSCSDGFYLDADLCAVCSDNCISCGSADVCDTCSAGLYVDDSNTCSSCATNCDVCGNDQACTTCDPGYINKDATSVTCDPCPSNCQTCTLNQAQEGKCGTCVAGYYADVNDICRPCSTGCALCSRGTGDCVICEDGYDLDVVAGECFRCPDNCVSNTLTAGSCSSNATVTECYNCEVGFVLNDALDTCEPCGAECGGYCAINVGPPVTTTCSCPSGGVNVLDDTGRGDCPGGEFVCAEGYYFGTDANHDGVCTACALTGCKECNSTLTPPVCSECAAGNAIVVNDDGSCAPCSSISSRCTACSDASTCTVCAEGYGTYFDVVNSQITCKACGTRCETCTINSDGTAGACSVCKGNHYVETFSGVNCKACNSPCTICQDDADGNTECTACIAGYAVNAGQCEICPDNCGTCQFVEGVGQCNDGACDTGYGNQGDGCGACPNNCDRCSVSTAEGASDALLCDTCAVKYTKNEDQCAPCPSNCETCTETSGNVAGATARTYFYLGSDGTCPRCPANCQRCSATSCSVCDAGYGLSADRKTCVGCGVNTGVDNCVECDGAAADGTANCFRCASGYVLSDDRRICNLTSVLGAKCSRPEDHYPECTASSACEGERFLEEEELDFTYPKLCQYECYRCGIVDFESMAITAGDPEVCNPEDEETANFTMTQSCYHGVCGVGVLMVDGEQSLAVRGCIRNFTCPDTGDDGDTESCTDNGDGTEICIKCCNGNLCNSYHYSSGRVVYASIAVILIALANALSLKI